jgi:hypothetical protein
VIAISRNSLPIYPAVPTTYQLIHTPGYGAAKADHCIPLRFYAESPRGLPLINETLHSCPTSLLYSDLLSTTLPAAETVSIGSLLKRIYIFICAKYIFNYISIIIFIKYFLKLIKNIYNLSIYQLSSFSKGWNVSLFAPMNEVSGYT